MLVVLSGAFAYATPYSDKFNDGNLDGWETFATMPSGLNGWAVLTDPTVEAYLYHQPITLDPADLANGPYVFNFDFKSTLSSNSGEDGFLDMFSVSPYFTNSSDNIAIEDLVNWDEGSMWVMDQDSTGITSYHPAGTQTYVWTGLDGWSRYWLEFSTDFAYVIPVFELFNLNGSTSSDSTVQIDNVGVPEPLSMVMLGCLGAGMLAARKMRRRNAGKVS
jgi:hypothetical protein